MNNLIRWSFVFMLSTAGGCRTQSSALQDAIVIDDTRYERLCATGEPHAFHIKRNESVSVPSLGELPVHSRYQSTDLRPSPRPWVVRFETCIDEEGQIELKQVLVKNLWYYTIYAQVGPDSQVHGLESAIFDGDYSTLSIVIPFTSVQYSTFRETSQEGFRIDGLTNANGQWLVAGPTDFEDGTHKYAGPLVALGTWEHGDPLAGQAQVCGEDRAVLWVYNFPDIEARALMCYLEIGTPGTKFYRLAEFAVRDHSPQLEAGQRGEWRTLTGSELEVKLKLDIGIHNNCDEMLVTVGRNKYFMLGPAEIPESRTCSQNRRVIPIDAPRDNDFLARAATIFGAQRSEGAWSTYLVEDCRHFAFSCQGQSWHDLFPSSNSDRSPSHQKGFK